jgi:hypothetical protein
MSGQLIDKDATVIWLKGWGENTPHMDAARIIEAQNVEISELKAELDQAAGVIEDRNREIADLVHDLDTAKSNTGKACGENANALRVLRQAYVTLAFAFNRLHSSSRVRDGELCMDFGKVRGEIEKLFREQGVKI